MDCLIAFLTLATGILADICQVLGKNLGPHIPFAIYSLRSLCVGHNSFLQKM